jgi:hypothetical protein
MSLPHLDKEMYHRLRSGEIDPAVARQIREHLASNCEICEAFLANLPPDGFDGEVDTLLASVATDRTKCLGNDFEFARIQRTLRQSTPANRNRFRTKLVAVTAIVLALISGFLLLHTTRPLDSTWDGIKGVEVPISGHLRFVVIEANAHPPHITRGENDAVVSSKNQLAFRVEIERPAYAALIRVDFGRSELIWKQHIRQPGSLDIAEKDGRAVAYPLHGLAGDLQFVLVTSERPLSDADFNTAATTLARRRHPPLGIGGDVIRVKIR